MYPRWSLIVPTSARNTSGSLARASVRMRAAISPGLTLPRAITENDPLAGP